MLLIWLGSILVCFLSFKNKNFTQRYIEVQSLVYILWYMKWFQSKRRHLKRVQEKTALEYLFSPLRIMSNFSTCFWCNFSSKFKYYWQWKKKFLLGKKLNYIVNQSCCHQKTGLNVWVLNNLFRIPNTCLPQ